MSNIFSTPIDTSAPSLVFPRRNGEVGVPQGVPTSAPLQTNSFYSNMLVENQDCAVWTHPYSVWLSKNSNFGLAMHYAPNSSKVFGQGSPPQYFYSPTGVQLIVLLLADFAQRPRFSLYNLSKFAATARFQSTTVKDSYLDCPLVQGMGFVTGVYYNSIPQFKSAVGFRDVRGLTSPRTGVNKYQVVLNDGLTWLLYVTLPRGQSLKLALKDGNTIVSSNLVDGAAVQFCYASGVRTEAYDQAAGCYVTNGGVSAFVLNNMIVYSFGYNTKGGSGVPLVFALPHQVASLHRAVLGAKTEIALPTTSKGVAVGFLTNTLTMVETMPTFSWAPFTTIPGKKANYSAKALAAIRAAAERETNDDVVGMSNVDSMYASGKILDKYAMVLYVCSDILKDQGLTQRLLPKMKLAIDRFANNQQQFGLFYDTAFKGLVSSATGNADYGNGHYNDHHFHWGYHIHAAAVTAYVDKKNGGSWASGVRQWVNTLVRDVANPTTTDPHFPVSRLFDFYHGHSWAKGLYASADGKDEESSSEDYHHMYGIYLWGQIINDVPMTQRAGLALAIMRRSMNLYMLFANDNVVQPRAFIPNRVSGILFENKLDHTTYFGSATEYIQGIHMLPITPCSLYVRGPAFVEQEWRLKLEGLVRGLNDGWKGILMLNAALFDPNQAFDFFNSPLFNWGWLDNGMLRTWSLAYCAGVGAAS